MIKKIISLLLVLSVLTLSFCACKKDDGTGGYITVNSQLVEINDILNVDGEEVSFDLFKYGFFNAIEFLSQSETDFDATDEKNFSKISQEAVEQVKYLKSIESLAEKYSITLSEEELTEIEETMENTFNSAGSAKAYKELLEENYLTPEIYERVLKINALYEKMASELVGTDKEKNKIVVTEDEIIKGYSEDYCRLMNIYFMFQTTDEQGSPLSNDEITKNHNEAKKKADEAYAKIKAGKSFEDVMIEYMGKEAYEEDLQKYYPTENLSGLLEFDIGKLKIGEVSQIIYAQQNYFIIKRLENDAEYLKKNISSLIPIYSEQGIEEEVTKICEGYKVTKGADLEKITPETIS